jgi:hypothetical protein
VHKLQAELREVDGEVNAITIELKSKIKKISTSTEMKEILNRLEIKGEPVWGLSSTERDLVREARSLYYG